MTDTSNQEHDEIPSQWVALKESAPSAPQRSHHARPSMLRESILLSGFESEEFDQSAASTVNGDDVGPGSQPQLAAKETRAVYCLKLALLVLMLALAASFAGIVFAYTSNEEDKNFEETFVIYSQQIEDAVQVSAQNRLEAIGALAFQIQTYVHDSNSSWPFVTVSFYEDRVYSMNSLTDAFDVLLFPVVSQKNRRAWEEYAVANVHWINQSYAAQESEMGKPPGQILPTANQTWFDVLWGEGFVTAKPTDFSSGISDRIFGGWDPKNDSIRGPYQYPKQEFYFPQWQAAPISWYLQTTINQNYGQFDDFLNSTVLSMATGNAIMGVAWTDRIVPGFITTMLYPIYREIYPKAESQTSSEVVAFLGADIYWKEYMTNIFQDDSAGAIVVIENNMDQVFTYKISGASVTYIGEDDLHDESYDDMEETFVFGSNLAPNMTSNVSSNCRAFLHQEWVQYTFRIYPYQDLEANFHTSQPAVYTAVVLLVTLIVAGTFFMYDYLVERRQKVVMRTAERSDAIVSSLFPKSVKEQLYRTSTSHLDEKKKNSTKSQKQEGDYDATQAADSENTDGVGATKARTSTTSLEGAVAGLQQTGPTNRKLEGPPIAELYDEATVFFADMVGFTAWSSQRSPADVFTLLETCYAAFDVIAHRRGVFKVETIGDCYVAVSGIPISRSDHAIIMAKFARDLLHSMSEEMTKLVPVLGSATASLAMRVGIHSGPVTAGVLRGERARFQLFGDTVNTAARMESTGLRNRIQLSQATADLLIKAGKQSWIIKRSDEVEAKGKGRMQTYWLKCSVSLARTKSTMMIETDRELTLSESDEASTKASKEKDINDGASSQQPSSLTLDETSMTEARGKEESFE